MELDLKDILVEELYKKLAIKNCITLDIAKELIEAVEVESKNRGIPMVIAVCNSYGNIIAVHVMDNSPLVSFDVAMKKAYTAVAMKIRTIDLCKLAQPGGSLYGVDRLDGGRIVLIGGGVPLYLGDKIVGGLGVSGGTVEEDNEIATYGSNLFKKIISKVI